MKGKHIKTARHNVAVTVNAGLTILYWQIGNRIHQDILKEKRAEYGNGFNYTALTRMVRFAEAFPEGKIVSTLSRQLSWSKNFTKRLNWRENGWRENLRSAGDATPAIKYPKAVIPAKAGIQGKYTGCRICRI